MNWDVENFLNWDVGRCYANINRELEGELELYLYEKGDNFGVKHKGDEGMELGREVRLLD